MGSVPSQNGFDYYETTITMGEEIIRYHFEIICGWITVITIYQNCLNRKIWVRDLSGLIPPSGRRVLSCTQIFVDRFYNGDPTNYGGQNFYIGDITVQR